MRLNRASTGRRHRSIALLAIGVALASGVESGCAGPTVDLGAEVGAAVSRAPMSVDGPLRTMYVTGYMDALLTGELVIDDECLVMQPSAPGGNERILVLWPRAAQWDDTTGEVVFDAGGSIPIEQQVALGGGMVSASDFDTGTWPEDGPIAQALASCGMTASSVWFASTDVSLIRTSS